MTATKYAVCVSDDNGWLEGCPDYEAVFFGFSHPGGIYIHPRDSEFGGHVEFGTEEEAKAFLSSLEKSGDWVGKPNGEEARPSYAMEVIEE